MPASTKFLAEDMAPLPGQQEQALGFAAGHLSEESQDQEFFIDIFHLPCNTSNMVCDISYIWRHSLRDCQTQIHPETHSTR
jgi:hypothetical protein